MRSDGVRAAAQHPLLNARRASDSAHLDTIEAMAHRAEVRATGLILLEPIRADPRPTYCSARHLLVWWRADCCVNDAS